MAEEKIAPMQEPSYVQQFFDGLQPPADWESVRRCQLCGRPPPYRVVVTSAEIFERYHLGGSVQPWQLVECFCGLRFVSPRWPLTYHRWLAAHPNGVAWSETLFRYGSFVPVPDPARQKANVQGYYRHNYRGVRGLLRRCPPRVLDVGSNVGWALKTFREDGADPTSLATDLEPNACRIAREEFGLNALEAAVCDLAGRTDLGTFDLIHCNDFIEHTHTPCDDLRIMRGLAEPGSVLWLKTFVEELDEKAGRTMLGPYSHFYHFTTHALRQALERAGWYPIRWHVEAEVQFVFVCVAV